MLGGGLVSKGGLIGKRKSVRRLIRVREEGGSILEGGGGQ